MLGYKMRPVIYVDHLENELKEIYGRKFDLRTTIMFPPGNDCYVSFNYNDGPLEEDEIEDYGKEYWEDFNCACKYLQSLNLPGHGEIIVNVGW